MNIRKIAELAGVSIATVSRVINNPEKVLPQTRELVMEVMQRHDYQVNRTIQDRLAKTSKSIAIVTDENNHNFLQTIKGIDQIAEHHNYVVSVHYLADTDKRRTLQLQTILQQNHDGLIMATGLSSDWVSRIRAAKMPLVSTWQVESDQLDYCVINQLDLGRRSFDYLRTMGQFPIYLLGSDFSGKNKAILDGFELAHNSHETFYKDRVLNQADWSEEDWIEQVGDRMQQPGKKAFICLNESDVYLIYRLSDSLKLTIPHDVALVYTDYHPFADYFRPGLTTFEQPWKQLGVLTGRLIFDLIDQRMLEEETSEAQQIALQPLLRIRGSCGSNKTIHLTFE